MRLYLANRMRGLPHLNWDWFIENARTLRAKGHEVVNPTEIDEEAGVVFVEYDTDGSISDVRLTPKYNYDEVMRRDLDAVSECDGIVMGPDWTKSEGARLERETAKAHGLTIYYGVGAVPDVTVPDIAGRDLLDPILDRVDLLRHQQRTGNEVRVTDPETGGAKGSKPVQLFSAPPAGLEALGKVCGMGADKYELHNFRKGYAWSLSANAMLRHYLAWCAGEDADPESGVSHMAHVAWHALVLIQFALDCPDKDDRYRKAG